MCVFDVLLDVLAQEVGHASQTVMHGYGVAFVNCSLHNDLDFEADRRSLKFRPSLVEHTELQIVAACHLSAYEITALKLKDNGFWLHVRCFQDNTNMTRGRKRHSS